MVQNKYSCSPYIKPQVEIYGHAPAEKKIFQPVQDTNYDLATVKWHHAEHSMN